MRTKFEVRQFAITTAATVDGANTENVVSLAKEIETYIIGNAEMLEFDDVDYSKKMTELLSKSISNKGNETETAIGAEERVEEEND